MTQNASPETGSVSLPERLALEAANAVLRAVVIEGRSITIHDGEIRETIAEAIRQALDAAARVARVWGLPPAISDTAALQREIAAAIEALK